MKQKTLVATCQDQPSDQPKGKAFATQPAAGSTAAQNSSVTVLISSGPQQVTVPPVVGETKQDAAKAPARRGPQGRDHPAGRVHSTPRSTTRSRRRIRPPGTPVDQGSFVNIVVIKFRPSDPSCVSPPPT